jgi:hypothetical protein
MRFVKDAAAELIPPDICKIDGLPFLPFLSFRPTP